MTEMTDARYMAVRLLGKTFCSGGYSNLLLNGGLPDDMDARGKAFCTALYYGVLERKITLDYIISGYCRQKLEKMRPEALNILRIGIYQLKFMESVPDNAAVNESVKLAKKMRLGALSGVVNGILRSFIRDEKQIKYPSGFIEKMSVEYSAPEWLIRMLEENYGKRGLSLVKSSLGRPPITVRLNTAAYSHKEILREADFLKPTFLKDCFESNAGDITQTSAYQKGMLHVQDIASQLCCLALSPAENDIVLDMCAAPGGKTFTMAELMKGKGRLYAYDLHENRVRLINNGAKRLKLENITAMTNNSARYDSDMPIADKILCDVPCSGLGVIRRKPEIKYKKMAEFDKLPEIQYNILKNAARHLKIGGEMVYSTCTVDPAENEQVIKRFLNEHPGFKGVSFLEEYGEPFGTYKAVLFPEDFGNDGFFIAKFMKME